MKRKIFHSAAPAIAVTIIMGIFLVYIVDRYTDAQDEVDRLEGRIAEFSARGIEIELLRSREQLCAIYDDFSIRRFAATSDNQDKGYDFNLIYHICRGPVNEAPHAVDVAVEWLNENAEEVIPITTAYLTGPLPAHPRDLEEAQAMAEVLRKGVSKDGAQSRLQSPRYEVIVPVKARLNRHDTIGMELALIVDNAARQVTDVRVDFAWFVHAD